MKTVRMGIIGLGNMGTHHVNYMNEVPGAELTAVADHLPEMIDRTVKKVGDSVATYDDGMKLIRNADVDAILIATPHYDHPPLTLAAFKRGLHVLCEKPVAVTAAAAARVNAAYAKMRKKPIWGAMFQQRTDATWMALKRLIDDGELGDIRRVNWIITNWYRSQAYYDSGGWRATWGGEGGGVLINQCPHNLDLIQWFVGMPSKVRSVVGLGKHHDIEVEDDVTAVLEYPNGATGVFVTTTGDAPGTNRLEVCGDKAKVVAEGDTLTLQRLHTPVTTHLKTSETAFGQPGSDKIIITPGKVRAGHQVVTERFVQAVLQNDRSKLVAEAADGIHGLELGNAMLMSGLLGEPVTIPTPRAKYEKMIKDLAAKSKPRKPRKSRRVKTDMSASF